MPEPYAVQWYLLRLEAIHQPQKTKSKGFPKVGKSSKHLEKYLEYPILLQNFELSFGLK